MTLGIPRNSSNAATIGMEPPRADVDGFFPEDLLHGFRRGVDEAIVGIHQRGRRGVDQFELGGDALGAGRGDGLF